MPPRHRPTDAARLRPPLRRLAQQVENLHVVFNNNYEDQGQRNAATLRALLEAAAGTALAPAGPG